VRWLAVALVLLVGASARADDDLAEVHRLEGALDYDRALALVEKLIARGGADPARLADLHLLAGKLAAGLDRAAAAEDHFARVLALRPDTRLPDGTSPKLTVRFEAARIRGIPPLHVSATLARGLLVVAPEADPLGLVVGVQVDVVDRAGRRDQIAERAALRVAIPPSSTATQVAALDANGNRVWVGPAPTGERSASAEPIAPPPHPPEHHDTPEGSSPFARWSTWAIAAGAIGAIGGGFAWRSKSLQDQWNRLRAEDGQHDYSSLQSIEHRGRTYAIAADISFGVAAAAGVVAVILAVTHRESKITVGPAGVAGRF